MTIIKSNDNLVSYLSVIENGRSSFSNYEQDQYPEGDTPFADMHRDLYVAGYVAHWRESISEVERCVG